ncbi:hypothetical protein RJ641_016070 [Dillenia turbinata]|uniref:Uncharacterized protein n=1 Tax=Dillenia turbinata TaxID=194707 RepID=A0AAN8UY52_9MAGN
MQAAGWTNGGPEALKNLRQTGCSHKVLHQLDVTQPASIQALADSVKTKFWRLGILVNNASVDGADIDYDAS